MSGLLPTRQMGPEQQQSPEESTTESSATPSRPSSVGGNKSRSKPPHVKFTLGGEDEDEPEQVQQETTTGPSQQVHLRKPIPQQRTIPSLIDTDASADVADVIMQRNRVAAEMAQQKASRHAQRLSRSNPGSRRASLDCLAKPHQAELLSVASTPPQNAVGMEGIPLLDMSRVSKLAQERPRRSYSILDDTTDTDSDELEAPVKPRSRSEDADGTTVMGANRLMKSLTRGLKLQTARREHHASGTETPVLDRCYDYAPPPDKYKQGPLSSILALLNHQGASQTVYTNNAQHDPMPERFERQSIARRDDPGTYRSQSDTPTSESGPSSRTSTPLRSKSKSKWSQGYSFPTRWSSSSLNLLKSSRSFESLRMSGRPQLPRSRSREMLDKLKHFGRREKEVHDTHEHVTDVLACRNYLIEVCRGLMLYGAPTYRLENIMMAASRRLEIEATYLYLPGCMVVSFQDSYATEVKLVKVNHGVDLGKFKDVVDVYKNVVHEPVLVNEGTERLKEIFGRKDKYDVWIRVLVFGMASVSVGPFAFGARPIDFPIIFLLGSLLGFLQLIVVPSSHQFQNVFEVAAAVCTSFAARGFGSIKWKGEYLFCFSAIAQSSIALILPGYIILCASLELQSRSIVAGSVRMVYAIIYALFLGFGITIGTAIFGLIYPKATSVVTCDVPTYWSDPYITHFPFVPFFTLGLIVINKAKWSQAPAMLIIAFAGYQTNFWSSRRFANNIQVANALGAFVVGSLGNMYSRMFRGMAAAAMLPAIFVQVPSGLAASGSLVAGLTSANQITGNATGVSVITNGTAGFQAAQNSSSTATEAVYSGTIFDLGYGMVQVAIGISVGLSLSQLVVYPFGKRRGKGKAKGEADEEEEFYFTF